MRSLYIRIFILLISINTLKAQGYQKTDSVFLLIKKYINEKNTDLIYELGNEQYKTAVTKDAFGSFLRQQIYPLGQIKQSALISEKDSRAKYKLDFESVKLELSFVLDKNNRYSEITFVPFKAAVPEKTALVATSNPLKSPLDKQIDSLARLYIQKENTVGLSIGILKDGKAQTYGYGETAKGNGKLPDANTIFEIASITKTFTSELLAYFVTQGKISLTDPITKYLPDSVAKNPELQKVHIINLTNHTSGIPPLPDNFFTKETDSLNPYIHYTHQMLFANLKICKLQSVPGEAYAYSNQAYGLLGVILERITGKTYEELIKQVITGPLKMNSTFQHIPTKFASRFVKVYNKDGKETKPWDFLSMAGGGSLRSTINDLLIYAKNNIKSEAPSLSKAFLLSREITFSKQPKVALGWHIAEIKNNNYYWHNGGTYGSSTFLIFNPEQNVAVVVLSNAGISTDGLGMGILEKLIK